MPPTENSPTKETKYLTLEQVLVAHAALIKQYGGSYGIREQGLLDSAMFCPQTSVFGQDAYPTLFEKCAVLGYSLIQNHPFVDGNKRTGFAAMHIMLLANGFDLTSNKAEEVAMAEKVASGKMDEAEISVWLKKHSRKKA